MKTNIDLDDDLVTEAFRLTDVRTKKELVNLALKEFVQKRKKPNLLDLCGKIQFAPDYDYRVMRQDRHVPD